MWQKRRAEKEQAPAEEAKPNITVQVDGQLPGDSCLRDGRNCSLVTASQPSAVAGEGKEGVFLLEGKIFPGEECRRLHSK